MDRIESFFLQIVAVGTVAMALCAGLSLVQPASTEQLPLVKLERVVVTPATAVAQASIKVAG